MYSFHNFLFYEYSRVYMIPMLLFNLYRLKYPIQWNDYILDPDQPGAVKSSKDERTNIGPKVKNLQFKTTFGDYVYKLLLTIMVIYYFFDSYVLGSMPFNEIDGCRGSYIFHHLVSIVGYFFLVILPHFPWFLMGPFTMHAYLMVFPLEQWLNYIYLGTVIAFMYGLSLKPFYGRKKYKNLFWVSLGLIGPLVSLWAFDCKNTLEHS